MDPKALRDRPEPKRHLKIVRDIFNVLHRSRVVSRVPQAIPVSECRNYMRDAYVFSADQFERIFSQIQFLDAEYLKYWYAKNSTT